MNKKQLLVAWCMGVAYLGWALWAAIVMFRNRHDVGLLMEKIPVVIKANLLFILPLLIVGCILIFTLQDKEA